MTDDSTNLGGPAAGDAKAPRLPACVDRTTYQAELDRLRVREKAHTREGCTWVTTQLAELSYLHSRDITYAVFCQGPYEESIRYHDFMGWDMPWYSAQASRDALLVTGAARHRVPDTASRAEGLFTYQ